MKPSRTAFTILSSRCCRTKELLKQSVTFYWLFGRTVIATNGKVHQTLQRETEASSMRLISPCMMPVSTHKPHGDHEAQTENMSGGSNHPSHFSLEEEYNSTYGQKLYCFADAFQ